MTYVFGTNRGGLETVRIHFLPILKEIGKCQNRKVSELESGKIGKWQNWKVSESESVKIEKCQNFQILLMWGK